MVESMLVASTAHVTESTCNGFLHTFPGAYEKGEYGWVIYADGPRDNCPADLAACLDAAKAKGCEWLMLDRDADAIEELPIFEW